MDKLPTTPTGKVDRRALPAPPPPAPAAGAEPDSAWSQLERTIAAEVIGPLLKLAEVGRGEDFFGLGGNSLQAMQVTSRVRDRFGVEIGLADFFAEPTVARLAGLVEQQRQRARERTREVYDAPPRARMEPGDVLPQSYPQKWLYQAEQDAGGHNPRYYAPFAVRMIGPLDLDALRRSFQTLVRRHATLRVCLHRDGEEFTQRVLDGHPVPFEVADVPGADLGARVAAVPRLVREEGERPFDLATGPLIRVRVHRLGTDDHVLQWTAHHLVTDGWSVGIQVHEIGAAYHAHVAGTAVPLEPLEATYADFVAWHRDYVASPQYREDLGWWRDRLRGVSGLLLPASSAREGHRFRAGYRNLRLPPELATEVVALGRRTGTTPYMVTLAAYATVLAAHAGRDDVPVVTPNALRVRSSWENLVGWFANRVIVRVRVDGALPFADLLRRTRAASVEAFAHQAAPFESLRTELELPDEVLAACYSLQNAPGRGAGFHGFEMEQVGDDSGRDFTPIGEVYAPLGMRYETSVMLRQRADGSLAGGWEYDAALFDEQTVERWSTGLADILARASATPEIPVRELRRIAVGG
jgi:acyl carrier protein